MVWLAVHIMTSQPVESDIKKDPSLIEGMLLQLVNVKIYFYIATLLSVYVIICVLATLGTLRYSELRKEMGNITDAVLASALKDLITNGIIERQSFDEILPRVEYSLSERGKSEVPIL